VGSAGPAWLEDEVGILATGAVWLAIGLVLLRAMPDGARAPRARVETTPG